MIESEAAENPLLLATTTTTPNLTEELQRDRRLIKEKLLRHSRRRKQQQPRNDDDDDDDNDDDDDKFLLRSAQRHQDQCSNDGTDDEEDFEAEEEESLEAMHHALTNQPMSWWAMRKQWQAMRRNGDDDDDDERMADGVVGGNNGIATAALRPRSSSTNHNYFTGHPVLLVDPSALGYETSSYRRGSASYYGPLDYYSKARSSIVYVSRGTFLKRRVLHMLYLVVSFGCIMGGVFVLEQRKLSHYALVESPISLSAYLAGGAVAMDGGEVLAGDGNNNSSATTTVGGDAGPMVCGIAIGGEGNGPNPNESFPPPSSTTGSHRLDVFKSIFVKCGVTPAPIFDNPASAQYRALHWMAYEDDLQYKPVSEYWIKKIIQRYALVALYYATSGEGWKNQLFFLSNRDECYWNRVYQTYFSGAGFCKDGFVTAIALWGNSLDGALPPELGKMTSLRLLSFFDNKIRLPPPESLVKLTSLERLYFQKNPFRGSINYLCPLRNSLEEFRADCGERSGLYCDCCTHCGYNPNTAKGSMTFPVSSFHN